MIMQKPTGCSSSSCGGNDHVEINILLSRAAPIPQSSDHQRQGDDGDATIGATRPVRPTIANSGPVLLKRVWDFAKEDRNRVTFSCKAGLAAVLVSFLVLLNAPYHVFGINIVWAILTVTIMFEYTVGATFNRGFNRGLGSLLAGVLAIGVAEMAIHMGTAAEPIVIAISIFIIGALTSFMKLWPSLVPYDYGFRIMLVTYCLVIAYGYRLRNPIQTALERLYCIAIGAVVAVAVNVLVFPIWAGEQLHRELVGSFNSVADSLEACVKKYLEDDEAEHLELKTVMEEFPDEPAYRKCTSAANSSAKLESLANSAKWEPPHGRFRHMYPWSEYVKVGAVLRYCAYEVMALHGVVHSEIQAPHNLRIIFRSQIQEMANVAAALIRDLGKDISTMRRSLRNMKRVHDSAENLQRAMEMHSHLLLVTDYNYSKQQARDTEFVSKISVQASSGEREPSSGEIQQSAPSSEEEPPPKMMAWRSTEVLSLATFTSLLVELVARLDHLVEAVDELSKMAKFKHNSNELSRMHNSITHSSS
ncbi:unnamed protein product [Linum tenue]|uniref:Uncharacterized protein n=1 Tax=Linum tenue TaxID=586396 RepID=A0AAV0JYW8_9ROSI|nr:unnamed protein product [Linum tenue]